MTGSQPQIAETTESNTEADSSRRPIGPVFVLLNPKSGTCNEQDVRDALTAAVPGPIEFLRVEPGVSLDREIARALKNGAKRIVAAGGDGTVSAVAGALVGTGVPLAILPLGTANVLAGELGIPFELNAACQVVSEGTRTVAIDAMKVNDAYYVTQVGVGLDAMMIRDTDSDQKRRFGKIAYIASAVSHWFGFQPRLFTIDVDGTPWRIRASQVLVANCGTLGQPPLRWGENIRPDDGHLDVAVIRARTLWHYLALGWHILQHSHGSDPNIQYRTARGKITITTRRPLPAQGDGEILGETPLTVELAPRAIQVLVP